MGKLMASGSRVSLAITRVELLLLFAVLVLVLQLFPSLPMLILTAADPRNWPRSVWFIANGMVVVLLIGGRFGPQVVADIQAQHLKRLQEREKNTKVQQLKDQRELLTRLKEARSRRLY